jgi:hypothetical protein
MWSGHCADWRAGIFVLEKKDHSERDCDKLILPLPRINVISVSPSATMSAVPQNLTPGH